MPLFTGLLVPIGMAKNVIITKHLTSERVGFDATRMTFTCIGGMSLIEIVIAVFLWKYELMRWDLKYFLVGLMTSIIMSIGIVAMQNAIKNGPAGPCMAISALSSPLLVIVQAVIQQKGLPWIQILAIIIGMLGVFIMVLPSFFEKYLFCCFFNKQNNVVKQ